MKNKLKTVIAFAKNIKTTGAISETSPQVEKEITSLLPDGDQKVIVEFGLGHGNITREILKRISSSSKLYSFEINKEFCEHVESKIDDPRLKIINKSAEFLSSEITTPIDGIVSSIPLTFFDKDKQLEFLKNAKNALAQDGYFSQILYSKKMQVVFEEVFDSYKQVKVSNLPTAYVHHCQKK